MAFYFKNKGIDKDAFRSKGFGFSNRVFKPFVQENQSNDGIMEFIFMKK